MAKRRLSQQQKRRIRHAQQSVDLNHPNNRQGLVISHHGGIVEVEPDGEQDINIHCQLRTNLGVIVSGDRVVYQSHDDSPAIIACLERDNLLQRQDGFGNIKAVAANVTQLLICLAVEPPPNLFLLDQYLLSAEQQHIHALIVLNKIDQLPADSGTDPFHLQQIYATLGYDVLYTSIKTGLNLDRLQQQCSGYVNVISGVSGVGKSSITQVILPHENIAVGEISEANREGRHTTRTSRLYHLPRGGDLIDTPGVRGFNPVLDPNQPLANGFREIAVAAQHCKFSNCIHVNEPRCAVIQAVQSGEIQASRYDNYLKLLKA
jgi:ribosome biogenesis GTPase